jgi:hypothetical protein
MNAKYQFRFWRPYTAIRRAAEDDNPGTEADEEWQPLFSTPPFLIPPIPEYPSGLAGLGAAAAEVLIRHFGDRHDLEITSSTLPGVTRRFKRRGTIEFRVEPFFGEDRVMYIVREVVNCKPGTVGRMVEKFRALSAALREMGHEPLRLMTDVSGGPFWTVVAEAHVERIDDFFAIEHEMRSNEVVRKTMAGYHDLIDSGRREIYRIES